MKIISKCPMEKESLLLNLQKGLEKEHLSLESCQRLIEMLTDNKDKSIVEKIMNDEIRHIEMVKELIKITENYYLEEI